MADSCQNLCPSGPCDAGRGCAQPSAADEARAQRSDGRIVVQAWLASRGLIALVALLLAVYQGRAAWRTWSTEWDVEHFTNLATNGYLGRADGTLMAFFPGLPALLALGLGRRHPGRRSPGSIALARRLGGRRRGPAPARRALGGGGLAVRADRGVHRRALHRVAVLRRRLLGLGTGPGRPLVRPPPCLTAAACTLRVSGLFLVGALLVMIITTPGPTGRTKISPSRLAGRSAAR